MADMLPPLWRSEPSPDLWRINNPADYYHNLYKKLALEGDLGNTGNWFTANKNFMGEFGPESNLIYELNTESPISLSSGTKNALQLAADKKALQGWVPEMGMGSEGLELVETPTEGMERFPTSGKPMKGSPLSAQMGKPLRYYFESLATMPESVGSVENPAGRGNPLNLTVPSDIASQKKLNLWESVQADLKSKNMLGLEKKLEDMRKVMQSGQPWKLGWETPFEEDWEKYYSSKKPSKPPSYWDKIKSLTNEPFSKFHPLINNPYTRFGINTLKNVGFLGDVALSGMALSDVFAGTSTVGNMAKHLNRAMNVPMDRQGRVIQSNRVYENLQRAAQRDVLNPNEMRGVTSFDTTRYNPREMNTGGIASLVL